MRRFVKTLWSLGLALAALPPAAVQQPSSADPMYTQPRNSALRTPASAVGVTAWPGETRTYAS